MALTDEFSPKRFLCNIFVAWSHVAVWLSTAPSARADIYVKSTRTNYTEDIVNDMPANFGGSIPAMGLWGYLVYASPADACDPVLPPPMNVSNHNLRWVLLARRSNETHNSTQSQNGNSTNGHNCNFSTKVRNAQLAGYDACIIHNIGSNYIEEMFCLGDCSDILIPSLFIGQDDGFRLQINNVYNKGYYVIITDELPFNLNTYLMPFAIVIGICFLVMLIFMVVKCVKDRRRARRHRMPSRSLKKIPTAKFKKGDPYDMCAVCLEEYNEGDKLRLLPCNHVYHTKCIDPWLTRNKRVCPCCKRKVFAENERPPPPDTDSDSDDDGGSTTQGETQPLLGTRRAPRGRNTRGGTFQRGISQSLPPFDHPTGSTSHHVAIPTHTVSTSDSDTDGAVGYSQSEPDTAYHSAELSEVDHSSKHRSSTAPQHSTPETFKDLAPGRASLENSINADIHEVQEQESESDACIRRADGTTDNTNHDRVV